MPKTAIFLAGFFLIMFLLQENSYGFTEGFDSPPLQNFDVELSSDIISLDVPDSQYTDCLLYTSPSPRDRSVSRMPSSA